MGCPAHAGIDLSIGYYCATHAGLPRTRGDRPAIAAGVCPQTMAAPHTRG